MKLRTCISMIASVTGYFMISQLSLVQKTFLRILRALPIVFVLSFTGACYHHVSPKILPEAQKERIRTLFIALDGIDYDLMKELKNTGYFTDFLPPVPLISTFPSATTIGFTGI